MNNNLKPTLWAVFFALLMMIWMKWEYRNAQPEQPAQKHQPVATQSTATTSMLPEASKPEASKKASQSGGLVHVKTDVLDLTIDTVGGTIVEGKLLNYKASIDDATPIKLFDSTPGAVYQYRNGVFSRERKTNATHTAAFAVEKKDYVLSGESLSVPLTWESEGIKVTKVYTFYRGRYDFSVSHRVDNHSASVWNGQQFQQIARDRVEVERGLTTFNVFAGGVYSTPETKYNKASFEQLASGEINFKNVEGGWVGMMQHYFMSAIIPPQNQRNKFISQVEKPTGNIPSDNAPLYTVTYFGELRAVPANSSTTFKATGFVGPKIQKDLARIAPDLEKATDYGPFFFISQFLFKVLNWVNFVLGNWGWAIIIVTIGIKTLLFPLAAKSFKSMAKMRKFQPEMERIRENYGEDRQLVGKKMMELYKKEGINPASGCLPILVQIPIFLAFYYMLMESVELRQAPWIFWIKDLSLKDPYYVLPVLNMGLMFLQQRLNPPPSDPIQRKVMMFMPLMFGFLFLVFPAGLVLYWAVSNSFSIIQQYVITKRYGGLAHPLSHAEDKHYHPKE